MISGGAARLAELAVTALVDEAELTPKPGLVDRRGSGAHADLDLGAMLRSAQALRGAFTLMAEVAHGTRPCLELREALGAIGREGEAAMLEATGGANAHRGAIWGLGLLVAGAAIEGPRAGVEGIVERAAELARLPDRLAPPVRTNGARACARHGVAGARGEAAAAFPHVLQAGRPALLWARARGAAEDDARLDALLALMATLDDTCLLHRGGRPALAAAQRGAAAALRAGGAAMPAGRAALLRLDAELLARNASPGGSADLLAAVLFLDSGRRPPRGAREVTSWRCSSSGIPRAAASRGAPTWGWSGRGILEVLLEPSREEGSARVRVRTSVDGYGAVWKNVLDRLFTRYRGAAAIDVNDFGATPGMVLLRLEQAIEESEA